MLEKILQEIRGGGASQPSELALRLNTSPAMIQAMLADLERMGYLRALDSCNPEACSGCQFTSACSSAKPLKTWIVS
jgi:hypothetical protein